MAVSPFQAPGQQGQVAKEFAITTGFKREVKAKSVDARALWNSFKMKDLVPKEDLEVVKRFLKNHKKGDQLVLTDGVVFLTPNCLLPLCDLKARVIDAYGFLLNVRNTNTMHICYVSSMTSLYLSDARNDVLYQWLKPNEILMCNKPARCVCKIHANNFERKTITICSWDHRGSDCGVFVMKYMDCIARGSHFGFDPGNINVIKWQLGAQLIQNHIP
uniref:Ubiquitin-like protease family profile domain-containing protein n=1 Tax=Nelumbo nucifera TaxID=4432 RepID=A0A822XV08_NELNU|nr:TPA_asm: hypothetical protein HUJ06_025630 [Nelumbo nucifera]